MRSLQRLLGCVLLIGISALPITVHAQTGPITTTLILWHSWTSADAKLLDTWIQDYQTAHPSIEIDAQTITGDMRSAVATAVRSGRVPDLFLGSSAWAGALADAQLIAPISAGIDKAFTAQITPLAWATVTYNSLIYAIPESSQGLALYYNSALTSKIPATLDDLLAQKPLFAFDFYTTAGIFLALGGHLVDDGGNPLISANTTFADYLARLKMMYGSASGIQTPSPTRRIPLLTDETFRLGSAPYLIDGNWKISDLRQYLGDKLHVAPLPSVKDNAVWSPLVTTTAFYLSANTGTTDAALAFARYVTEQDRQSAAAAAGQIPVNPKTQIDDPVIRGFFDQFALGVPSSPRPEMVKLWPILDDAVYAVTVADQPVAQVVQAVAARLTAPTP